MTEPISIFGFIIIMTILGIVLLLLIIGNPDFWEYLKRRRRAKDFMRLKDEDFKKYDEFVGR